MCEYVTFKLLYCFEYTQKWQRNRPIVCRWSFSGDRSFFFFLHFGKSQTLKTRLQRTILCLFWVGVWMCNFCFQWPTNQISFWSQRKLFFFLIFFSFASHCYIEIAISLLFTYARVCMCADNVLGNVSVRFYSRISQFYCFYFDFCCFCFHFFIFVSFYFKIGRSSVCVCVCVCFCFIRTNLLL